MADYEIRAYEADDRDGFLELYADVLEGSPESDWFAWKYEDNPYVDHVPIVVATDGETILGARSFFALRLAVDGEAVVVLQPCDTMVHPDHRRRGLFRRMTERAIERYEGDYPLFFNFPNSLTLQGNLEMGWRVVTERTSYYRIDDPAAYAREQTDRTALRVTGRVAAPVVAGHHRLLEARYSPPADVSVREASGIPAGELSALYRGSVPEAIHAVRDETFYEWRFENPDWKYATYVADGRSGPEAAVVAGTSTGPGPVMTRLTDVVPIRGAPEPAVGALLDRVIEDRPGTDLFVAPSGCVPPALLRGFGFLPDSSPLLSALASQTTHVVRSLSGDWEHGSVDLTDPDEWSLTFAEEDTS